MGTRSAIAVKKDNGTVQGIYCHWDGYPTHNGQILANHYPFTKALQLVSLGNLSYLREEIGEQQDFDARYKNPGLEDPNPTWSMFYGRDRGEAGQDPKTFNTVGDFVDHFEASGCEYFYFVDTDGDWWVSSVHRDRKEFDPVEYAIEWYEKEYA